MKIILVLAASSVAMIMAASSALAVQASSHTLGVKAQSETTAETAATSARPIFMPSQTTQKLQLRLNQDKHSRQFLISKSERIIGCGRLNDPKSPTNVRMGPDVKFQVVSSIDNGTFVSFYQRKNGWVRITPQDSSLPGWISESLLKKQRTCP